MRQRTTRASLDRLLDYLTDADSTHPMADELHAMLEGSPRFAAFADVHRDKIRKKLRTAADADALSAVRAELSVAHLLLADRHIDLGFEEGGVRTGGPDFTVRYRGDRPVACEVTRMRRPPGEVKDAGPVLTKLRQLLPGSPNVLVIALDAPRAEALDVDGGVRWLRHRADTKDEEFFTRRGFAGSRDFYSRFLRLGAVLTWTEAGIGEARAVAWTNRSARIPVPERALRAMLAAMR